MERHRLFSYLPAVPTPGAMKPGTSAQATSAQDTSAGNGLCLQRVKRQWQPSTLMLGEHFMITLCPAAAAAGIDVGSFELKRRISSKEVAIDSACREESSHERRSLVTRCSRNMNRRRVFRIERAHQLQQDYEGLRRTYLLVIRVHTDDLTLLQLQLETLSALSYFKGVSA